MFFFLFPPLFPPLPLTSPHKTESKLTNCDCFLVGPPLGITPNGCCAVRLIPSPTAMEACQAMQVTFITPWMRAPPLKEDTSNLFLLSKKELLIWAEELEAGEKSCVKNNKQTTNGRTEHATTRCQSGRRRRSWIGGCPCWWCGLLVFPACPRLPSRASPAAHRPVGLQWWRAVLAKDKDYWAAPREDGFGIKCLC